MWQRVKRNEKLLHHQAHKMLVLNKKNLYLTIQVFNLNTRSQAVRFLLLFDYQLEFGPKPKICYSLARENFLTLDANTLI